MDHDTQHKVNVIIGTFTVSCFAVAFVYGLDAVVAWAIGMLALATLICALGTGSNSH